jgi:hypothetical protein
MLKNRLLALTLLATVPAPFALAQQTACVSMQGNGERYPALIAQVMALLERNIEPKVIFGGSSASGAAVLIQGVLNNPSVRDTRVVVDGRELSTAEKAARIIATSTGPIGTVIVLPGLNNLGQTIPAAVKYVGADSLAQAFVGYPDQTIANIESSVGQITLLSEFFATADFSSILQEQQLAKRSNQVFDAWVKFADMVYVTPNEFIRALITGPKDPRWTTRSENIKKRYFDLFFDETSAPENRPDPSREAYNKVLNNLAPLITRFPDESLTQAFLSSLGLLRGLPFVSYTAVVASKPFYLPNGERVQRAFEGRRSGSDQLLPLPKGTIVHTTARAAQEVRGRLTEKDGLDNFYQVYLPSTDLREELLSARNELADGRSFLEFQDSNSAWINVLPPSQLTVLQAPSTSYAIRYSVAEPNAFRRDAFALTPADKADNHIKLASAEKLVTFGGWMEHANRRTLDLLASCADVDYLVEVSTLSQGLYDFQLKAIRAVIAGGPGSFANQINGNNQKPDEPSRVWLNGLWNSFRASRDVRSVDQGLLLDFDWDNASGLSGDQAKLMNPAYDVNRNAFFVRAYQYAADRLDANGTIRPNGVIGADLRRSPLGAITDPATLNAVVDDLLKN